MMKKVMWMVTFAVLLTFVIGCGGKGAEAGKEPNPKPIDLKPGDGGSGGGSTGATKP